jgi:hypothetical protein
MPSSRREQVATEGQKGRIPNTSSDGPHHILRERCLPSDTDQYTYTHIDTNRYCLTRSQDSNRTAEIGHSLSKAGEFIMNPNTDQGSLGATIIAVITLGFAIVLLYLPLFLR